MANSTLFVYNTNRNEYQLTLPIAKLTVATKWLRSIGCVFTTHSDRVTGTAVLRFNKIEQRWALALNQKHGRRDVAAPKTAATSSRVRKAWVAPVEVAPVVFEYAELPPFAMEEVPCSLAFTVPVPVFKPRAIHTASQLAEPAMPNAVTETVGAAPVYMSPAFATKVELVEAGSKFLYKLAQDKNVKGRSKMNLDQLAEALVLLVKKSELPQ